MDFAKSSKMCVSLGDLNAAWPCKRGPGILVRFTQCPSGLKYLKMDFSAPSPWVSHLWGLLLVRALDHSSTSLTPRRKHVGHPVRHSHEVEVLCSCCREGSTYLRESLNCFTQSLNVSEMSSKQLVKFHLRTSTFGQAKKKTRKFCNLRSGSCGCYLLSNGEDADKWFDKTFFISLYLYIGSALNKVFRFGRQSLCFQFHLPTV